MDRSKNFRHTLPSEERKLYLNQINKHPEAELCYVRNDISENSVLKKVRNRDSKAAIRKREYQKKKRIISRELLTNREIDR